MTPGDASMVYFGIQWLTLGMASFLLLGQQVSFFMVLNKTTSTRSAVFPRNIHMAHHP